MYLANGVISDSITEYTIQTVCCGVHTAKALFYLATLATDTPIILGLPWLQQHDPHVSWAGMSLEFNSRYCQTHCLPWNTPSVMATMLQKPHRPPVRSRPQLSALYRRPYATDAPEEPFAPLPPWSPPPSPTAPSSPAAPLAASYRQPYVTDTTEPLPSQTPTYAPDLTVPLELTPGQNHYITRRVSDASETRAQMIRPPPLRPLPVGTVAGSRRPARRAPPPPLPLLHSLAPVPQNPSEPCPEADLRPDVKDIRMANATSFIRFCKQKDVKAFTMTWDEIDAIKKGATRVQRSFAIPDLPEAIFRNVLTGTLPRAAINHMFTEEYHDFLDEIYEPLHLNRISEADIEKFMKGKPQRTDAEIREMIPPWLRHWTVAFLPRIANRLPPSRSWDLRIDTQPGRDPPYSKNRPLNSGELLVVSKWLDDNLAKGFIRESRSRCAAPLMLASKPGGGVRICQDYRGLNNVTIKNRYPIPLIKETLEVLTGSVIYTKLDIIAAFNNIRIAEGDVWKTAFITRRGLYETLVMPFGLSNAPAQFQHYINHCLGDLLDSTCTAYLDDVLVYSKSRKEHRQHVDAIVQRLYESGLQIDIDKCEFETTRVKYLGLIVTPTGIEMDPDKVASVLDWPEPPGLKDLQKFLGFANFYRRFIKGYSKLCAPLHDLLKRESPWHWGSAQREAFNRLKTAFASGPVLTTFDYTRRTVLETDASDWASGGVLSQYDDDGVLRPVAYFSSKHSAAQCNYEIYDKELLAIIKCLEEWRPELQGSSESFEIVTDHKNLQYFMTTKALSQRQVRWSEFLSGFNFRIVYRPGKMAVRPDALSRKPGDRPAKADLDDDRVKNRERTMLPPSVVDDTVRADLNALNASRLFLAPMEIVLPAEERSMDDLIDTAYVNSDLAQVMAAALRDEHVHQWPSAIRKELRIAYQDCTLIGNRVYYRQRLFVPPNDELRTQILYRNHNTAIAGHPGRTKTLDVIQRSYWWPRITQDVAAYVQACELCVRTKTPRSSPPGFLQPLPVPFRAWSDISVDYITPLPKCQFQGQAFQHIVSVVCRLTKMRHFIPTVGLTAEELADAFVSRIYCLHGCPETIISDRGTQFVSEFWRQLSARLNVTLRPSSAYHPQTDGQTERINAIVEQYLRSYVNFAQDDWAKWLPLAEFTSNNAVSETTNVSPFFANYGFNPRLGIEPTQPAPPDLTPQRKKEFLYANQIADRFERIITRLKALATQAMMRYEVNANLHRTDMPAYTVGQRVYVNVKNLRTNRPARKLDDKWVGPFAIAKVYRRACFLTLPSTMKVFPVFHTSLLRPAPSGRPRPGQAAINEAERLRTRGRVWERDDDTLEDVARWEFESILDCHNQDGLHYQIKWRDHAPSWQPAIDLKGCDDALIQFHAENPDKPGPPAWFRLPAPPAPLAIPPAPPPIVAPRRSTRLRPP